MIMLSILILSKLICKSKVGSSSILKTVSLQDTFKHLMYEIDFCSLMVIF